MKEKQLISQRMREISPEMDPLRLGTGWSVEDLSKPQIFIESTFAPKKADMARDILQLICAMVKARAQTASTTHLPVVK